jgi:hypothetical protein
VRQATQPVQQVPFPNQQNKARRAVSVNAALDSNLRLPTPEQLQPKRAVQANPPIQPIKYNQPNEHLPEPTKVLTNSPDLAFFNEEAFQLEQMPDDNVEMRPTEKMSQDSMFGERLALPSNNILYDAQNVFIRPFKAPELAMLYKAKKRRDTVLLYDTLDKTLNVSIRKLWTVDARWVMYWHRMNSFIKTPYLATWQSIYGNSNKTKIALTDVSVTPLKMTKERYQEWYAKGYKVPDVQDSEHYSTFSGKLEEDQAWLYERAMYLQGSGLHEQKAKLDSEEGVELLYEIKEFIAELSDSGIYETTQVKDQHFVYDEALKTLAADLEMLNNALATEINLDPITEELFYKRRDAVQKELTRLISNPGEAEPMLETINLKLGILDFFPDLF